jgi:hypothetical protein
LPKFHIGAGKILANASTSLLGLLRANTRIFLATSDIILGYALRHLPNPQVFGFLAGQKDKACRRLVLLLTQCHEALTRSLFAMEFTAFR